MSVVWTPDDSLVSVGDDKKIVYWGEEGPQSKKEFEQSSFVTSLAWLPSDNQNTVASRKDIFVVGCAEGCIKIMSKPSRIEKTINNAHEGAVLAIQYNYEGTSIISGGEDGVIKVWSIGGQIRSVLASTEKCVYSVAWGPFSEKVVFTNGQDLVIKSIHGNSKQLQWRAHEGFVLAVDWNPLTNLIVSGSDDGKYKVWDAFGRNLWTSPSFPHSITAVSWSPDGSKFLVGSFNSFHLCDQTGNILQSISEGSSNSNNANGVVAADQIEGSCGTIFSFSWTKDNLSFAAGTSTGKILIGEIFGETHRWGCHQATVADPSRKRIILENFHSETKHKLDFTEKIVKISLGYGFLIVVTRVQCWIYEIGTNTVVDEKKLSSPRTVDINQESPQSAGNNQIMLILQSKNFFLITDKYCGIQCFTYQGRLVSTPKPKGIRYEFLNDKSITISEDAIAILDKGEKKSSAVLLFPIKSENSASINNTSQFTQIQHTIEIEEIALSKFSTFEDRKIVFIDRNRDLYLCIPSLKKSSPTGSGFDPFKIGTMADSVMWNSESDILCGICDSKLHFWLLPDIVFEDPDLLPKTTQIISKEISPSGKKTTIESFNGTVVKTKKWDGTIAHFSVSPFPIKLHELLFAKQWESAIRLCRFVKEPTLWAMLAGASIRHGDLKTAEVALAAILEVDKLAYISKVNKIQSPEEKSAWLAVYKRRTEEAESILLQAGLFFKAMKLHVKLFNWERALEIATRYKVPIDILLYFRAKHLQIFGRSEEIESYQNIVKQNPDLIIDEQSVKERIKQFKQKM